MARDGCLFCGGKPLTIEHVIPNWLGKELPTHGVGPAAGFATGRLDLMKPDDSFQFFLTRKHRREGLKTPFEVRQPCEECNTGWMHRLEVQVQPWLTPMIHGRPVTVPDFAIRSIAAWSIKTALFFRYSDSPPVETPAERNQWLFRHKTPPSGSFVFLARYEGESAGGLWMRGEMTERPRGSDITGHPIHLSSMRFGDLVVFVVEMFSGNQFTLPIPEEWKPALARVWPITSSTLVWPPGNTLTEAGVRHLVRLFEPSKPKPQGPRKPHK